MTARAALRAATDAAHDRVDAYFSRLNLSDRADYGQFLLAQAAAFLPIEAALDAAGAGQVIDDWSQRRRSDALLADLKTLGLASPPQRQSPSFDSDPAIWGGAYVLEGSRLGGALLKRQLSPGLPRSFLDAPSEPGGWRRFLIALERNLVCDVHRQLAGQKAIETFACFMPSGTNLEHA